MAGLEQIKKKARGLRIGAVILWVLAIGCEVLAIYLLNNVANMIYLYIAIGADAVLCIIGALMWKRANRLDPCKSENKLVKFLWDQMGVIACLIAFIPFGLFLLNNKEIDSKTKKQIAAVAGILFLGTMGTSIDYNPVEPGDVQHQEAMVEELYGDTEVYWTEFGKSYHVDRECFHIADSENVYSGTVAEAMAAKKNDPCDHCVGDLYSGNDTTEDDSPVDEVDEKTTEGDDLDTVDDADVTEEETETADAA